MNQKGISGTPVIPDIPKWGKSSSGSGGRDVNVLSKCNDMRQKTRGL